MGKAKHQTIVKTTLLILFSTCFGLLAQAPPTNGDGSDPALRDAILRAIVREEPAANGAAVPGATAPAASTATAPVVPVPGAPPANAPANIFARQAAVPPPAAGPGPATVASQPAVAAQPATPPAPPEEATNFVDFPGIDINTFLDIYADQVGRTVLRAANLTAPPITLHTEKPITHTDLVEAMKTVMEMNGVSIINLSSNMDQALMAQEALASAAEFSTTEGKNLPNSGQYIVQMVPLKYVKPSAMVQVLQPFSKTQNLLPLDDNQMLIIRDYSYNVKRMLELVAQVDTEVSSEFQQEVIPIKYAHAEDIANVLSSLGGSVTSGMPGNAGGTPASGGGSRLGGPAGGLGGGYGGANGQVSGTGAPLGGTTSTTTTASAPNASFQDRLRRAVQGITGGSSDFKLFTGVTKILPDSRANALMVFANDADMKTVKKIVSQLDVILPQVLIEAIIMEVNLDDERNLGVSYLQQNQSTPGNYFKGIGAINNGTFLNRSSFTGLGTNGASALPGGLSYAAAFGNDFDATVTAIATDSRIDVLSRPRIQTSHGIPAELQVGNTIPYVSQTYGGGLAGGTQSSYQQTFVGIDLQVTPLINSDGLVVMSINQDVEQLGPTTDINGTPVPSTTKRSATATVSVRDRDTVILGGFISSSKTKANSGVPVLKDIPGLGALFRSSSDSIQKVELIVLIRPTVLPTPESAAIAARDERNRMPLVKAAERDYRQDENKRLKEADKIVVPDERSN